MDVREIRESEESALADLTVAAYRQLLGELTPAYAADLADVTGRRATSGLAVLVAVDAGVVVGGVTYVQGGGPYAEFPDSDEAGFRHLAVTPDRQGRGAGRALVEACISRARATGARRLGLFTTEAMTTAQRLYEALGFVRTAGRDWVYEGHLCLLGYQLHLTDA